MKHLQRDAIWSSVSSYDNWRKPLNTLTHRALDGRQCLKCHFVIYLFILNSGVKLFSSVVSKRHCISLHSSIRKRNDFLMSMFIYCLLFTNVPGKFPQEQLLFNFIFAKNIIRKTSVIMVAFVDSKHRLQTTMSQKLQISPIGILW